MSFLTCSRNRQVNDSQIRIVVVRSDRLIEPKEPIRHDAVDDGSEEILGKSAE
jgi:hypothetical protein